jgi:RHS repeat-associated protein
VIRVDETLPATTGPIYLPVILKDASGEMMAAPPPVIPDSVFLSPLAAPTAAAPPLSAAHYPADPLLNTTLARTIVYTYDNLYRLTGAGYSTGASFAYSYDDRGNRTQQTVNGQSIGYTYDDANRLTSVNGQSYSWDDNSNLLNDGTRTFNYDTANRLTSVVSGAVTTQFGYNGDGDRISQTVNGLTTEYILDPIGLAQVLVETNGGQSNYYLPGLAQYNNSGAEYFVHDRLGSIRQIVDPTSQLLLAQSFEPFGNVLERSGVGSSIFGYTGEQTDPTGLIFLRARYYDPAVGRFISPDSIVPDPLRSMGWNRYAYVENNPIRYTDPSGHQGGPLWDMGPGSEGALDNPYGGLGGLGGPRGFGGPLGSGNVTAAKVTIIGTTVVAGTILVNNPPRIPPFTHTPPFNEDVEPVTGGNICQPNLSDQPVPFQEEFPLRDVTGTGPLVNSPPRVKLPTVFYSGWQKLRNEDGQIIEVRKLSKREAKDMGVEEQKEEFGGARSTDDTYIDRNGGLWIRRGGGPLIDFR